MHAHIFTKEALEKLRKKYKSYVPRMMIRSGKQYIYTKEKIFGPWEKLEGIADTKKRIEIMDIQNVDVQVLSNTPQNFCYNVPSEVGMALSCSQNDAIAEVVGAYPERFVGVAVVPLQDVDGSVEELDRAVKELGMRAVHIGTNIMGTTLDSMLLWPFYEKVQRLDIPIIIHPTNHTATERMRNYYMINSVGNPLETALAITSVLFGGVLDRFKRLKFCWGHGGGYLPYQVGRLEHCYKERPEPKVHISKPPSEYLKFMYFDIITHNNLALKYLIESMGSNNVLMGSDFPYDMGLQKPVSFVNGVEALSEKEKKGILGLNSVKLFKIEQ